MNKGSYYKIRTRNWFVQKGYFADFLEKSQRLFHEGQVFFRKQDVAGADGIAMNGEEIIFWQSKLNSANIAVAIKEFHKYPYPPIVKRWIVVWAPRAREPEIIEVEQIS